MLAGPLVHHLVVPQPAHALQGLFVANIYTKVFCPGSTLNRALD